jgi:hypothetical protein
MKRTILALTLTLLLSSVTLASTSSTGTDEEGMKNPTNNTTGNESTAPQMGIIWDTV